MANINSLTNSNSYSSTSSIYGNRNVLTGLASGMDTETMIQNSVTGYQTKISQLQQSQEKLEWKQDAYRELIDQMYGITNKYTSYTSSTNLSSNAFFTSKATTTANGKNASALLASGKATSDVQINAVTKLATAARYAVDSKALNFNEAVNLTGGEISGLGTHRASRITGSLTLRLGSSSYTLDFGENDVYANADELLKGINEKLKEQKADVEATLSGGRITFSATGDAQKQGDSVYISGASGDFQSVLGVKSARSTAATNRFSFTGFNVGGARLSEELTTARYLSDKTVEVTLNGVTKKVSVGTLTEPDLSSYDEQIKTIEDELDGGVYAEGEAFDAAKERLSALRDARDAAASEDVASQIAKNLQENLNKAFGAGAVTVSGKDGKLTFGVKANSGSTLLVNSDTEALGVKGVSNYFNTGKTLGTLLGDDYFKAKGSFDEENAVGSLRDARGNLIDLNGNRVDKDGYLVDDKGNTVYEAKELIINGQSVGSFSKGDALEQVMTSINGNVNAGVNVSFSKLTGEFVFTARETGAGETIEFGDGLASRLFGAKDNRNTTLGELFGDAINWSGEGTTKLYFSGPATGATKLQLSADSTVQDLIEQLEQAEPYYAGMIQYDADTGTFSLVDRSGKAMDDDAASAFRILQTGARPEDTAELTLNDLLKGLTGASRTAGQDAVVSATVNGRELELIRSTNVIEMDGMTVTLKNTFNVDEEGNAVKDGEAVTFTTSSNSDAIVDAIKSFVEDVNKLMTSVHNAYTTQPLTKTSASSSSGTTYYEPLTEDDKNGMSESAIEKYEEKAKTGLLFGDTDLRTLYDKLLNAIQSYGADRISMKEIGLETTYSAGITTLKLNEETLRAALDSDPDKVRNVFTKTKEGGSATDGLMATLKAPLSAYGSTSLANPGILVSKAGTKLSAVSLLNNNIAKQISNLDSQIESWQTKLSNRIDYYTKQFTQLEQLMSTMNNQSSMLADLMGY